MLFGITFETGKYSFRTFSYKASGGLIHTRSNLSCSEKLCFCGSQTCMHDACVSDRMMKSVLLLRTPLKNREWSATNLKYCIASFLAILDYSFKHYIENDPALSRAPQLIIAILPELFFQINRELSIWLCEQQSPTINSPRRKISQQL